MIVDRRSLIVTGTLGLAGLAVPGFAQAPNVTRLTGFTHSVASGEPGADSMLLWTRYVPAGGGEARLGVELSKTPDFARPIAGTPVVTGPWRDHTAKIAVDGLEPGTRYHYRFVAPDGSFSPVGRTRTLPRGPARSFRIAVFSCSNLPFGYFNAYAHAAARDDIDLAVHLGDYYYEYQRGNYPSESQAVDGRWPEPAGEIQTLADYRLRHASYRADPDLMALHASHPMLVQWDDHETANDSWEGGAQNHQASEGDWSVRKAMAVQAYREWMPISDEPWKTYEIGGLATLFRTESRLGGRTRPRELSALMRGPDAAAALARFRDGAWQDPAESMLGSAQESWLGHALAASVRSGARWQVVGFGTILGEQRTPVAAADWLRPDAGDRIRGFVANGIAAGKAGLPSNLDNWGGYPAARRRFLARAQALGANLVVISGDSHNAWAFDLAQDGRAAGVEFAGQAVTSPGYESSIGADPRTVAAALVAASPELKWCDTSRRGYMALTLAPDRVTNEWLFVDTIRARTPTAQVGHRATVLRGRNRIA